MKISEIVTRIVGLGYSAKMVDKKSCELKFARIFICTYLNIYLSKY